MLTDYTPPCAETPAPLNTIQQAEQRAAWAGDAVLTPHGVAVAALHRLTRALDELGAADRAAVLALLALLAEEIRPRIAGLAAGA
jgi:hypothetical protein